MVGAAAAGDVEEVVVVVVRVLPAAATEAKLDLHHHPPQKLSPVHSTANSKSFKNSAGTE